MLKYAKNMFLNLKDINKLNAQVAAYLANSTFTNSVIVI